MKHFALVTAFAVLFTLSACIGNKNVPPKVDLVKVHKAERKLHLIRNDEVVESFDIALGFTPVGHKQAEGDGKTPEGRYIIDRRNPNSQFHLSLGISYPNSSDRWHAKRKGESPGGDIFIHGQSSEGSAFGDWTAGCIAVSNEEIEMIYAMVPDGTVIEIFP